VYLEPQWKTLAVCERRVGGRVGVFGTVMEGRSGVRRSQDMFKTVEYGVEFGSVP